LFSPKIMFTFELKGFLDTFFCYFRNLKMFYENLTIGRNNQLYSFSCFLGICDAASAKARNQTSVLSLRSLWNGIG
jgi:hypothetical protein